MSLLDEELLISATEPAQLLKYPGNLHVRDVSMLLEEVLYWYQPDGVRLPLPYVRFILREYDSWVEQHAVPMPEDLVEAADELVAAQKEGEGSAKCPTGFYRQQSLVKAMRYGELAEQLHQHYKEHGQRGHNNHNSHISSNYSNNSSPSKPSLRHTTSWTSIRKVIDLQLKNEKEKGKINANKNEFGHLKISNRTVPFNSFSKWLYKQLKQAEESMKSKSSVSGSVGSSIESGLPQR